MSLEQFFISLNNTPEAIQFNDTISAIDAAYEFTPTSFKNGTLHNEVGQNSGSCKIFFFAKINGLSKEQTLACFGDFYRLDVLRHPDATDHQNIRNFMQFGWAGIQFDSTALNTK